MFLGGDEAGPALTATFAEFPTRAEHGCTILRCEVRDQAALYGVLHRVEALGLALVDVRSVAAAGPPDTTDGRARRADGR